MVFVGLQETIQVHNAPASLMPSCRICPSGAYAKGSDQTLPPSHIEQIHWYSSECIDFIQNGPLSTILPYRLTNCLIYFDSELHVIFLIKKQKHQPETLQAAIFVRVFGRVFSSAQFGMP